MFVHSLVISKIANTFVGSVHQMKWQKWLRNTKRPNEHCPNPLCIHHSSNQRHNDKNSLERMCERGTDGRWNSCCVCPSIRSEQNWQFKGRWWRHWNYVTKKNFCHSKQSCQSVFPNAKRHRLPLAWKKLKEKSSNTCVAVYATSGKAAPSISRE